MRIVQVLSIHSAAPPSTSLGGAPGAANGRAADRQRAL